METKEFNQLMERLGVMENEVRRVIAEHKEKKGRWDCKTEAITDKIALMGAWVFDVMHSTDCPIDEQSERYNRSMKKKFRKALGF